jgi:uncharacterized cupredoxin-like copper-binding protein
MRGRTTRSFATLGFALLLVLPACGGDDNGGGTASTSETGPTAATGPTGASATGGGGSTVDATEKDFAIGVDPATATAGTVDFEISNAGPSVHEFVVFQTDLAPDQLPVNDDGTVNEEGKGVTHIDEVEDIAVGATESLSVDLDAGNYVLICNLPGHYQAGMHTAFTVA